MYSQHRLACAAHISLSWLGQIRASISCLPLAVVGLLIFGFGIALTHHTAWSAEKLSYRLASPPQKVPYGGSINIPYILDSYDVDGDGADDFAISAMTLVTNTKDYSKNRFIHSFFVHNMPEEKQFQLVDLGEAGKTHRTWAGKFFKLALNGNTYLALARAGEIGPGYTVKGEIPSILKLTRSRDSIAAEVEYLGLIPGKGTSVSVCDINEDGNVDLLFNNGNSPYIGTQEHAKARVVTFFKGRFHDNEMSPLLIEIDGRGYHTNITLDDVNEDGRCDLLAAYEPWKIELGNGEEVNANKNISSYTALNSGANFQLKRMDLPGPPFGKDNSAFSIATAKVDGKRLVALDSSKFPGPRAGFSKFKLQLYELKGQELIEVTKEMLVGKIANIDANECLLRFFDIDGDGDKDLYISRYDRTIDVYVYDKGKFDLQRLNLNVPGQLKAVAFLRTPKSRCADIAVVDRGGRLYRFECLLK